MPQALILVGGLGTRLGGLTKNTPKPLLKVCDKPFLEHLISELARHGIDDIVLLAGVLADQVTAFAEQVSKKRPEISLSVVIEPEPKGTAGALRHAEHLLRDHFFLLNGDSFFDCNLLKLALPFSSPETLARMALRPVSSNTRYGLVQVEGAHITAFAERDPEAKAGMMNAGIYWVSRKIIEHIPTGTCSLENMIFPQLAKQGLLEHTTFQDIFFMDIGIPEDLELTRSTLQGALTRPAVFFDRDGVLNHDYGHVHSVSDFRWVDGAMESILACNDAGYFVFVVTNQAGIAKGFYAETAMQELHAHMQAELRAIGAHVDAFAFCPHHPEGVVPYLRQACTCRKPEPGMILRLCEDWNIVLDSSFLIGDKTSDIQAANAAGMPGYLFSGGRLLDTLLPHLPTSRLEYF